jgi:hypothetical protein
MNSILELSHGDLGSARRPPSEAEVLITRERPVPERSRGVVSERSRRVRPTLILFLFLFLFLEFSETETFFGAPYNPKRSAHKNLLICLQLFMLTDGVCSFLAMKVRSQFMCMLKREARPASIGFIR